MLVFVRGKNIYCVIFIPNPDLFIFLQLMGFIQAECVYALNMSSILSHKIVHSHCRCASFPFLHQSFPQQNEHNGDYVILLWGGFFCHFKLLLAAGHSVWRISHVTASSQCGSASWLALPFSSTSKSVHGCHNSSSSSYCLWNEDGRF